MYRDTQFPAEHLYRDSRMLVKHRGYKRVLLSQRERAYPDWGYRKRIEAILALVRGFSRWFAAWRASL
jgi:hypothetical protein